MYTATEILRSATEDRAHEDFSGRTHYEENLVDELRINIKSILPEAQKKMLETLCETYDNLCNDNFEDGILYGIQLTLNMQSILDNPEKIFRELRRTYKDVYDCNKEAVLLNRDFSSFNKINKGGDVA